MDRRTLIFLASAVGALAALLIAVGLLSGGIDRALVSRANAELSHFDTAQRDLQKIQSRVDNTIQKQASLFAINGYDKLWPGQLAELKTKLDGLSKQKQSILTVLEANDAETSAELSATLDKLTSDRVAVMNDAAAIEAAMQKILQFKQQLTDNLSKMQANRNAIASSDLAGIETKVNQAIADWPNKKSDLEQRLAALRESRSQAETLWENAESIRAAAESGQLNDAQLPQLIAMSSSLQTQRNTIEQAVQRLPELIDQLYWAWDEIMADITIQEGWEVAFRRKLETVKVPALAAENSSAKPEKTERWENITEAQYKQWKNQLGMTVKHKPGGKYDHEAESMVQPAGYAYMAPPHRSRNHYGYWDNRGGSNVWVWYGQYSFMRDMFWGPRYTPITVADYGGYERARRTNTPYYAQDQLGRPRYGSSGTLTRSKYSGSKYVQTGGYKNSQYVSSGGKYRGQRYVQRSRPTTTSSRSTTSRSSFSSSSSRSYRSPSRSGSRSSGGK